MSRALVSGALVVAPALFAGCGAPSGATTAPAPTDDRFYTARGDRDFGWDERFALHIGSRWMDDDFLPGAGNDLVVGIEISGAPPDFPLDFVLGLFGSGSWGSTFASDKGAGLTIGDGEVVSTGAAEISFGARIAPVFGRFRPYAGIGIAGIRAHRREVVGSESVHRGDSSAAGYWHSGIDYLGSGGWTVGVHFRELFGSDLRLGDEFGDADYRQISLSLGMFL